MPKPVAQCRITAHKTKHYWKVKLWAALDDFWAHISAVDSAQMPSGLHAPRPYRMDAATGKHAPAPMMGTIHFVSDEWDMEVVAHECCHALSHYITATGSEGLGSLYMEMPEEEVLCYIHGKMISDIYRWLWEVDSPANRAGEE